jgi:hypothetical protein
MPSNGWAVFMPLCYNARRFEVPSGRTIRRLNGKQVKNLCCPRNGKQVWAYRNATVNCGSWEGDALGLASPDTGPKQGREMLRAAVWTVSGRAFALRSVCLFAGRISCVHHVPTGTLGT